MGIMGCSITSKGNQMYNHVIVMIFNAILGLVMSDYIQPARLCQLSITDTYCLVLDVWTEKGETDYRGVQEMEKEHGGEL